MHYEEVCYLSVIIKKKPTITNNLKYPNTHTHTHTHTHAQTDLQVYITVTETIFPVNNVHTRHVNVHVKITTLLTEELAPAFNSIFTNLPYPLSDAMWRGVSSLHIKK